ncbi:hypothetical protein K445DRAFT_82942 [Daldinia sp. EC12]|nr:hypothetical protein K445DRAFT_82942 [Daldinia sp. EC12]
MYVIVLVLALDSTTDARTCFLHPTLSRIVVYATQSSRDFLNFTLLVAYASRFFLQSRFPVSSLQSSSSLSPCTFSRLYQNSTPPSNLFPHQPSIIHTISSVTSLSSKPLSPLSILILLFLSRPPSLQPLNSSPYRHPPTLVRTVLVVAIGLFPYLGPITAYPTPVKRTVTYLHTY